MQGDFPKPIRTAEALLRVLIWRLEGEQEQVGANPRTLSRPSRQTRKSKNELPPWIYEVTSSSSFFCTK